MAVRAGAGMRYGSSVVWIKSMRLAARVIVISRRLPAEERYGLRSQITRAATSVPSNIAEGFGRFGNKEFARCYAKTSGC